MKRLTFLLPLLLVLPVLAEAGSQARPGNLRGYETDILFDTFGFGPQDVDADVDQVYQGCPRRDCIPSIDHPSFLAAAEVDFLDDDDLVISITLGGETRAYPTRILDRHEIVNDRFGDTPIAVTYCPLCGSGLAFVRTVNGQETEFGVSGLLHNNDLIMYDRKTESLWQQITGQSLAGPKQGETLEAVPVAMMQWGEWRAAHPGAVVLAPPLGSDGYVKHVYGDYATSDRLLFPVEQQDARLHAKKVIYGIETGGRAIAVESDWLQRQGGWEHDIDGQTLRLRVEGGAVAGTLAGEPIPVHRMYWFAWYSFHPGTSLIGERNH